MRIDEFKPEDLEAAGINPYEENGRIILRVCYNGLAYRGKISTEEPMVSYEKQGCNLCNMLSPRIYFINGEKHKCDAWLPVRASYPIQHNSKPHEESHYSRRQR